MSHTPFKSLTPQCDTLNQKHIHDCSGRIPYPWQLPTDRHRHDTIDPTHFNHENYSLHVDNESEEPYSIMIERYVLPEMAAIWSVTHKTDTWLQVELLVCEGWAREGVIPPEAIEKIRQARYNMQRMREIEQETHHDVISFLRSIQEQLGPEGRFIHLGLTSSDVLDTGLAVQIKEAGALLTQALSDLIQVVGQLAVQHKYTLMAGRTHGIHAEPITFGLKLALWYDELRRQQQRLAAALEQMTVGKISGAVGTHATIPPQIEEFVCEQLGLGVAPISSQIIQRDRHAHFMTTLALVGSSLEKMAQEIRHLQRTELSEVFEPFGSGQQGSSAMPHKRNPELCERICGLARVLRGFSVTAMENVALWHERDISHSSTERIIIPDGCILLHYMLHIFTNVMKGLQVDTERMLANLNMTGGLVFSQRILLALIDKGVGRQEAYKMVQRNARQVWGMASKRAIQGPTLLEALSNDPEVSQYLSEEELKELTDTDYYTKYIDISFKRVGL
jgi:adenylosuccinate lyase